MPTRKINNEQEAAEAFSDRAFFRVGDRFISPDEIISCRRITNGYEFTLSDGTTVQHDRFKKGSTGHFLFEQLSKVEGRFSETLKPDFNRLLVFDAQRDLQTLTEGGAIVNNYGPGKEAGFNVEENIVAIADGEPRVLELFELDTGQSITSITAQITDREDVAGISIPGKDAYMMAVHEGGDGAEIVRASQNGTTASVKYDSGSSPDGAFGLGDVYDPKSGGGFAVLPDLGSDGFAYFLSTSTDRFLYRLPLDSSTQNASQFANAPWGNDGSIESIRANHEENSLLLYVETPFSGNALWELSDPTDLTAGFSKLFGLNENDTYDYRIRQIFDDKILMASVGTPKDAFIFTRSGEQEKEIQFGDTVLGVGLDVQAI